MQQIENMPHAIAAAITGVFADIDDTLTTNGRLPGASYQALEDLFEAGFVVVPVTGRPAGWCDMIARFWPVTGVIGENGAFYFAYDVERRQMRRVFCALEQERAVQRLKLTRLRERILAEVPNAAVSADQAYREADLAIDFCEDVPALSKSEIARIRTLFEQEGAQAKVSSIHVNGWFGDHDKLSMTRRFVTEVMHAELDAIKDTIVFCGDSPNDAPMFEFFPNACGVANVRDFLDEMQTLPAWVTQGRGGTGFVEVARFLLRARPR